ncbi:pyrimidine Reductase [Striga asiatica]|uniref:Pyrimidine Reductase n=1 Tax=Striga asiatica TaxID=4170 RepID=A0A5A7R454_STRAF|nr:pyrimidine Reductase [Striga asiatica]
MDMTRESYVSQSLLYKTIATQDASVRIWWILNFVKQVVGGVEEGLGVLKPDAVGLVTGKWRLEQAVLRHRLDSHHHLPLAPRLFGPSPRFFMAAEDLRCAVLADAINVLKPHVLARYRCTAY